MANKKIRKEKPVVNKEHNDKSSSKDSIDEVKQEDSAASEAVAAPVVEAVAEPVAAPVVEAVAEPVAAPVVEAVAEPVAAPVVEAVAEPVAAPVVEAVAESVVETVEQEEQPDVKPDHEHVVDNKSESDSDGLGDLDELMKNEEADVVINRLDAPIKSLADLEKLTKKIRRMNPEKRHELMAKITRLAGLTENFFRTEKQQQVQQAEPGEHSHKHDTKTKERDIRKAALHNKIREMQHRRQVAQSLRKTVVRRK